MSGTRKLKKLADSGITARKIMVVPCMVNNWLYTSGLMKWFSGRMSWRRIRIASSPPMRKKQNAVTPYSAPMRL